MIKLVAFLGNYGREYEKTRHNVAWQFEDSLAFANKLNWQSKFKGNFAAIEASDLAAWCAESGILAKKDGSPVIIPEEMTRVYFLKPETYMNLSGESIIEIANFYKIKAEETLVVHDELELPLGTVSLKWSGGLGGHNGLRSTKQVFGTADFWRLRFGLTKPNDRDIASYVLGKFTADQEIILSQIFPQTATLLAKVLFSKDPSKFIQEWGKKKLAAETK
ncbi:MAG: aminoacyl-tRNA hydrolase [Treponema sp.]|nr:aminoacyl-tRNA hydrolase [Treponema sp.]